MTVEGWANLAFTERAHYFRDGRSVCKRKRQPTGLKVGQDIVVTGICPRCSSRLAAEIRRKRLSRVYST